MHLGDVVGVCLRDLFDIDATHIADDHDRLLGDGIEGDAEVVLLRDAGLGLNEDVDRQLVLDRQLQDLEAGRLRFVGRVGEEHTAGLHAASGQHLRLEHHGPADVVGDSARLLWLFGGAAFRQADTLLG